MRISSAIWLLVSGSIPLVESAFKKPSSLREILENYTVKRNEILQHRKEQTTRLLQTPTHSVDANTRYLQGTAPTRAPKCDSAESVNFGNDDFNQALFEGNFDTVCTCSEADNLANNSLAMDELLLNANTTDSLAEKFNTLVGSTFSSSSYECINGCEACINGFCGLLETAEESYFRYAETNFTDAEILAAQGKFFPTIGNITYYFRNCFEYTTGSTFDGKLCFGVDLDTPPVPNMEYNCFMEYDDVLCNSCSIDGDLGCYVADCTNIDSAAMIDSCNVTGFAGPFAFLALVDDDNITGSDYTLGSCDIQNAPAAPTGSLPTAPVGEPSAPVTAPSATITSPTAPVAKPVGPVATPVTAPAKAPSAATPTTSGVSVCRSAFNVLVFGFVTAATYFT